MNGGVWPLQGWVDDPQAVAQVFRSLPHPVFSTAAPHLMAGEDKNVLLYKAWTDVYNGKYPEYPAQTIGDCVSQGFAHGTDLLAAIEIVLAGENESYKETATEAVYGMARVDIGGGRLGRSDGAVGAWAAKAVSEIGTVSREVVGPYDGARAKKWGFSGVPTEIKSKAGEHKVGVVSRVSTWAELTAALANGYPVPVCSNQGFTSVRDANGFCRPQGTWAHCMLVVGIRIDIPGAAILNSWGKYMTGPTGLDLMPEAFWADKRTVERILAQNDSWALGRFDGYPGRDLPSHWSYGGFA